MEDFILKTFNVHESASHALDGINNLIVDTRVSRITLISDPDVREAVIDFTGTIKSVFDVNLPTLSVFKQGDALYVRTESSNNPIFNLIFNFQLDLIIRIPFGYAKNISCTSSAGQFKMVNDFVLENFDVKLNAGTINIDSLKSARCDILTGAGSIAIRCLEGDSAVKTNAGSITIRSITGKSEISTGAGSIKLNYTKVTDAIRVTSSAGSVTVGIPPDTSADISMFTSTGNLTSDLQINVTNSSRNRLDGTVGAGGPKIDLSTSAGSISILTKEPI